MASINKILANSSGSKKTPSQEAREAKDHQDEIVKELVKDSAPPPVEKKPRGRPRSSSTEKTAAAPKAPPSNLPEIPLNAAPVVGHAPSPLSPADQIDNEMTIATLQAYTQMFPEIIGNKLDGYNPYLHPPAENKRIIESIASNARDKTTLATMPYAIATTLHKSEDFAMYWAVSNPTHRLSPMVLDLEGIASEVMQDPILSTELKLLQCELVKHMPKSPVLRIGLGLFNVVSTVMSNNKKRRQFAMNSAAPVNATNYEQF